MAKRKYVDVTVSWCYGDFCPTAKVPVTQWASVLRGKKVSIDTSYWYEGERFSAVFSFNCAGSGTLIVIYDGSGIGFDGRIEEAEIVGGQYPARKNDAMDSDESGES